MARAEVKPRLLDLFCGVGGASKGYDLSGFDVVGVDIKPQPNYQYTFVIADALEYLSNHLHDFQAYHASPPCQRFTQMAHRWRALYGNPHIDLLTPTIQAFSALQHPWVIENVVGARRAMSPTLKLHGGLFGLGVHRPRLFQSNIFIPTPYGTVTKNPVGVYGAHLQNRRLWTRSDGSILRTAKTISEAQRCMGIDWSDNWREICEAIPPAYTQWIGRYLLAAI